MTVVRVNLHPLFFGPEYSLCYLIINNNVVTVTFMWKKQA